MLDSLVEIATWIGVIVLLVWLMPMVFKKEDMTVYPALGMDDPPLTLHTRKPINSNLITHDMASLA